VNDAINRVLEEREHLDRGLPAAVILSVLVHLFLAGAGFAAVLIKPREPSLKVAPIGFVVELPPGGQGTPAAAPAPAPAPPAPPVTAPPQTMAAKPEPPPKFIKPPKPEPRHGLPEWDAPRVKSKPETPPPRPTHTGTGSGSSTPGLEIAVPGAGVPGGMDPSGDFYLASVYRKIWMVWTQQIKPQFNQPIAVTFTILADGQVTDVRVVQPSGVTLLDLAAQRAILSAAPFNPLPKDYGTNRYTIQALFRPTTQ
jgi:TonB family protein